MVTEVNAPLDRTHEECKLAVIWINGLFQAAKERAAEWTPRPWRT